MRRALLPALAVLAPLAGCGNAERPSTRISGDTLTVYTGLPLRGERAGEGRAVLRGEKLALDEVGGKVGDLDIGLVALDDTRTSTGRWDPRQVAANAREAAENPSTIAYIGDLDSGATAISVPIVNEIGVLQVSPLSGYSGLTEATDKGEPDKYYPSGVRTFARLVPSSAREARGLADWIRETGHRQVVLVSDGRQEGLGHGTELERALRNQQVMVADAVTIDADDDPPDVAGAVREVVRSSAPAVVYAGGSVQAAAALLGEVARRAPGRDLFATSGVAGPELAAAVPDGRLRMVTPVLPLARRPAAALRVAARYRELFGEPAPPAALYGYEAMRTVLDAIRRAGKDGSDRTDVIDAYLGSAQRDTVLGSYVIGSDGDVSGTPVGGFEVRSGRARFALVVAGPAG